MAGKMDGERSTLIIQIRKLYVKGGSASGEFRSEQLSCWLIVCGGHNYTRELRPETKQHQK